MPHDDPDAQNLIIPRQPYLRLDDTRTLPSEQQAAAGIVRNQIDTIYQHQATAASTAKPTADNHEEVNPYDRTHQANRTAIHVEQWKRYHSAWQDYYRQYYERYYLGEAYRIRQALKTDPAATPGNQPQPDKHQTPNETDDTDDAIYRLKGRLLKQIGAPAMHVRRSRHFIPLMAAGLTMAAFLFLQYNRVLFATVQAYVSPGNINPANIIVDPNISVPVSKDPVLIIPKINVDVPVVYDTKPDAESQLKAMEGGVAWFGIPGANSRPGQVGNTVLSGHSSNDLFDSGNYKFIFARLEQLVEGDIFYLNYDGKRYTYTVTKKEVVRPADVAKLVYATSKPVVTLITCVPVGTAKDRLLLTAEQVSPSPTLAGAAPSAPDASSTSSSMPGNSPTFIDRLFGRTR